MSAACKGRKLGIGAMASRTDRYAVVVDPESLTNCVACERLEFVGLSLPSVPYHCLVIQNLRSAAVDGDSSGAVGVTLPNLGDARNVSPIVDVVARRAIVAAKQRKLCHGAKLPEKRLALQPRAIGAEVLIVRI